MIYLINKFYNKKAEFKKTVLKTFKNNCILINIIINNIDKIKVNNLNINYIEKMIYYKITRFFIKNYYNIITSFHNNNSD